MRRMDGKPIIEGEGWHMNSEAGILLEDVIEYCRRDRQETRLINMLEQCRATDFDEETLTVRVPSRFACSYLEKHRDVVERYLGEITFMPVHLEIQMLEPESKERDGGLPAGAAGVPVDDAESPTGYPTDPAAPSGAGTPKGDADAASPEGDALEAPASSAGGESRGSISVVNTLSLEEYNKLVEEMRDDSRSSRQPTRRNWYVENPLEVMKEGGCARVERDPAALRAGRDIEETDEAPSLDINAKFTFESFVAGDENRHAFNSAMRFAAYAEEKGQCPSLFIYGHSGLGKTHLLFAVRNYLAKERPNIKVKYANSQAYLDDYMTELGNQEGPGSPIMSEYRDADILIIDDVQNIVGKQASVEFFFQLVDSFIREGKKVAFASDRAPKDLAMDERLTSRFSRGMLCLVSEPGFEMKYIILKRYYETIIKAPDALDAMNVDTSLLSQIPEREGHLSDEHLRHMAEISGNNIRNLESFCERCAWLAAEREAAGGELTVMDIDEVGKAYFNTTRNPVRIDTVQRVVEEFYHVSHEELIGPRRTASIAFARHVAVYLANNLCEMTTPAIGAEFGGRDHSTVLNSLKVVENKMREDRRICVDVQNLKKTILLKS